jgi:hypothetical protein
MWASWRLHFWASFRCVLGVSLRGRYPKLPKEGCV